MFYLQLTWNNLESWIEGGLGWVSMAFFLVYIIKSDVHKIVIASGSTSLHLMYYLSHKREPPSECPNKHSLNFNMLGNCSNLYCEFSICGLQIWLLSKQKQYALSHPNVEI